MVISCKVYIIRVKKKCDKSCVSHSYWLRAELLRLNSSNSIFKGFHTKKLHYECYDQSNNSHIHVSPAI